MTFRPRLQSEHVIDGWMIKRERQPHRVGIFKPRRTQNERTVIAVDCGKKKALTAAIIILTSVQQRLNQPVTRMIIEVVNQFHKPTQGRGYGIVERMEAKTPGA